MFRVDEWLLVCWVDVRFICMSGSGVRAGERLLVFELAIFENRGYRFRIRVRFIF